MTRMLAATALSYLACGLPSQSPLVDLEHDAKPPPAYTDLKPVFTSTMSFDLSYVSAFYPPKWAKINNNCEIDRWQLQQVRIVIEHSQGSTVEEFPCTNPTKPIPVPPGELRMLVSAKDSIGCAYATLGVSYLHESYAGALMSVSLVPERPECERLAPK